MYENVAKEIRNLGISVLTIAVVAVIFFVLFLLGALVVLIAPFAV